MATKKGLTEKATVNADAATVLRNRFLAEKAIVPYPYAKTWVIR
jgi:hypothetical protein